MPQTRDIVSKLRNSFSTGVKTAAGGNSVCLYITLFPDQTWHKIGAKKSSSATDDQWLLVFLLPRL
jgi:hypothetical protein